MMEVAAGLLNAIVGGLMDIDRYKQWCLNMEASGNHGSRSGPTAYSSVDWRRGIMFWGQGRGWQLKKNWRDQWAVKFPHVELPPKPAPPPRVRPLTRNQLEKLVEEYKSYNPDVGYLQYWADGDPPGWRLEVWAPDGNDHRYILIGGDSHDAAKGIRYLIDLWKRNRNISGQEPGVGGQAQRTGHEPMISQAQTPLDDTESTQGG